MSDPIKKIVLAYSGGLDTSVILRWLIENLRLRGRRLLRRPRAGRGARARSRARRSATGASQVFIDDLREEFVRDFVFPMLRANAVYEGSYLLGTSIARPLIAKRQIEVARRTGADAVAHGATGKGNDQVRFELTYYALEPDIRVIAPWRDVGAHVANRADRVTPSSHGIPVPVTRGEALLDRTATCCTSATRAASSRIRGTSRTRTCSCSRSRPEKAPERAGVRRDRLRGGRPGGGERRAALARGAARPR